MIEFDIKNVIGDKYVTIIFPIRIKPIVCKFDTVEYFMLKNIIFYVELENKTLYKYFPTFKQFNCVQMINISKNPSEYNKLNLLDINYILNEISSTKLNEIYITKQSEQEIYFSSQNYNIEIVNLLLELKCPFIIIDYDVIRVNNYHINQYTSYYISYDENDTFINIIDIQRTKNNLKYNNFFNSVEIEGIKKFSLLESI